MPASAVLGKSTTVRTIEATKAREGAAAGRLTPGEAAAGAADRARRRSDPEPPAALVAPAPVRAAVGWLGRRAPGLTAAVAEAMFLTPPRFRRPPRERRWLEGAERFTLETGGRRLPAWSWGDRGPAVLLMHGWAGRGSQLGAFAGVLAAAGLRAIAFDAPGHGDAPGRRSTLMAMGEALLAVAAAAGPIAGVVAHSAGSAATTWALRRGLAAPRLVYIAPPAELSAFARTFGRAVGLPPGLPERLQERVERRIGMRWVDFHGLDLARTQRTPLLVVHDREDGDVDLAAGAALAGAWPGADLHVTEGLGHRRVLRDPDVVREVVDYLTGDPARPAAASSR